MKKYLVIGSVLATLIIGAGVFSIQNFSRSLPTEESTQKQTQSQKSTPQSADFTGQLLAGTSSPYLTFNTQDYKKALEHNKIIFLDFYANWCPICRVEAPEIEAGFNSLTTDKVVGFRVNFNDSETDGAEKTLAKEFSVPYQHTKIILVNGKEVLRSSDQWDKDDFVKEINTIIGQ